MWCLVADTCILLPDNQHDDQVFRVESEELKENSHDQQILILLISVKGQFVHSAYKSTFQFWKLFCRIYSFNHSQFTSK